MFIATGKTKALKTPCFINFLLDGFVPFADIRSRVECVILFIYFQFRMFTNLQKFRVIPKFRNEYYKAQGSIARILLNFGFYT